MKSLQEKLMGKDWGKELLKHPRHKLIDVAVKQINIDRIGTKYRPTTPKIIGMKTAHLSLDDFHYLVKVSQQKGNFSRMFFGLLKPKPDDRKAV